ncbi:hypothetical protein SLA2020_317610 [Shorea laevis]
MSAKEPLVSSHADRNPTAMTSEDSLMERHMSCSCLLASGHVMPMMDMARLSTNVRFENIRDLGFQFRHQLSSKLSIYLPLKLIFRPAS